MAKRDLPVAGAFFEGRYPFVRSTWTFYDGDGTCELPCWKPGTRAEYCSPDDTEMVADGEGSIILTVISVHKPGRFPARIFFTRLWRDPNGREFGNRALRCVVASKFYKLATGYRHEYRILKHSQRDAGLFGQASRQDLA